ERAAAHEQIAHARAGRMALDLLLQLARGADQLAVDGADEVERLDALALDTAHADEQVVHYGEPGPRAADESPRVVRDDAHEESSQHDQQDIRDLFERTAARHRGSLPQTDEGPEAGQQLRLRQMPGLGQRGHRLGHREVLGFEADHVRRQRLIHLGLDVDVAHAHLARLRVDHETERNRHQTAGLNRNHGVAAALEQKADGPVAEAAAVRDVVRSGRRAAELVAHVLGHDGHLDATALEACGHALLEDLAEIELGQPNVAVRVALHAAEGPEVELLAQPLRQDRHAVLAALYTALDDGALQRVGELVERDLWLGKFLGDQGEGGRG